MDSSVQQIALLAAQKHVAIAPQLDTDTSSVRADRELATRVLVKVLGNALRFSPPESSVTVRVAPWTSDMPAFSVHDQGPGIPKDWADKIFDKFTQVDARKDGAAVGSGLGLTFCELAVQAQGGRIWLESEVGNGTTVFFTLPVVPARDSGAPASR